MRFEEAVSLVQQRSRFLTRAIEADASLLKEVLADPCFASTKGAEVYLDEAGRLGGDFPAALRRWRKREFLRICLRETISHDLQNAMRELSDLASAAVSAAMVEIKKQLEPRYGQQPCDFCVVGMGKLGGHELNLSSDIDVIYLYETDVDSDTHPWFRRYCERLTRLLTEVTPNGFVYRVDLGLRPEGRTGAICNSLAAAERYYEVWGHAWERVAWLRARPIAGACALGDSLIETLRPFVYPTTIDLKSLDQVSAMKAQIDRTAHGRTKDDIKLGAGGIREIEFYIQALQLVHGGRIPALRERNTLVAVEKLNVCGLVTEAARDSLAQAYLFLRAVEHQLQLVDERQTHELPIDPDNRLFVANALGYPSTPLLEEALATHRQTVTRLWDQLFVERARREETTDEAADAVIEDRASSELLNSLGYIDTERAEQHFGALRMSPKSPLHPRRVLRDRDTARILVREIGESADPDLALTLLRDLMRALRDPDRVWGMVHDRPQRLRTLIHLLGTSRFLGRLIARDPTLLQELVLAETASLENWKQTLARLFAQPAKEDTETALIQLRKLHHAQLLRIGFQDIAGELEPSQVETRLTVLAEQTICAVLEVSRSELEARSGPLDGTMAVVGFGRLGAQEMTYGSDLDLMFVYDGNKHTVSRWAYRFINGLSLPMATGRMYEVDTRLRPSGNQGPLLVTPDALRSHYSLNAATWEILALQRARAVAGDPTLIDRFQTVRAEVLASPPDADELKNEAVQIHKRHQAELAREGASHIDVKYGAGGLVEIDLVVQTLRMNRVGTAMGFDAMNTVSAIAGLLTHGAIDDAVANDMTSAYHYLRKLESRLRIAFDRPIHRIEINGAEMAILAKRMGYHNQPGRSGVAALLEDYRAATTAVRAIFHDTMGVTSP